MGKKPDVSPIGKIKLVDLPRTLIGSGVTGVSYNQCYSAAVNGLIPAERNATDTRWAVDEQNLPSVIKHFTLLKDKGNGQESQ